MLVVDLELLLPELFADLALLLKIVGEVEGLDVGANASMVGEEGANISLVGSGVSVSEGLGVANGSVVGVNGSGDGDGEEISAQQKGSIIEPSRISLHTRLSAISARSS